MTDPKHPCYNGTLDIAYVYGNDRLSLDRFDGSNGYYLYDPRGSVTGITNEDGQLYQSYRYDAFGAITFGAPQYENEYTYNGESYNPNIESQYLRARYYDVVNGNFLTEDSYLGDINAPLTLNRYNYCVSSPLNYVDPSGHTPEDANAQLLEDVIESRERNESAHQGMVDSLIDNFLSDIKPIVVTKKCFDDWLWGRPNAGFEGEWQKYQNVVDSYLDDRAEKAKDVQAYYTSRCGTDFAILVAGGMLAYKGVVTASGGGAATGGVLLSGVGAPAAAVTIPVAVVGVVEFGVGGYIVYNAAGNLGDNIWQASQNSSSQRNSENKLASGGKGNNGTTGPAWKRISDELTNKSVDVSSWNKGSFNSIQDSLAQHFLKHGEEVGATNVEQYLRKAEAFMQNLRGASKYPVSGSVEGVMRYVKNGKYIDLAPDGTIISFGRR